MIRPVAPNRRLLFLCILMLLGLLRAERGVAELQGRAGEPSRILYIRSDRNGTWDISLLGIRRSFRADVVIWQQERPLLQLPAGLYDSGGLDWAEVDLPVIDWHGLARRATALIRTWLESMQKAAHSLGGLGYCVIRVGATSLMGVVAGAF